MGMNVVPEHMSPLCMCSAHRFKKRATDPLVLELQIPSGCWALKLGPPGDWANSQALLGQFLFLGFSFHDEVYSSSSFCVWKL